MRRALLPFFMLFLFGCNHKRPNDRTCVEIKTDEGNIRIELFNETPVHRDNFIQLVEAHFYDGLLFHRVIPDFMIQGGDPASKNAKAGEMLGSTDSGELLDPEFRFPRLFHKRGALAAAREGDDKNPLKKSSGSQFYLVWGKLFSDKELKDIEDSRNEKLLQQEVNRLFSDNEELFNRAESSTNMLAIPQLMDSLRLEGKNRLVAENRIFAFPDSIRDIYKTIGGTPWLDNEYTVFGEVTEGLDVIEKIQSFRVDRNGRPTQDIKMKIRLLK